MGATEEVIACKNCSIVEAWVAIMGPPAEVDLIRPYGPFDTIKKHLQVKNCQGLRTMLSNSHRPPSVDMHHDQSSAPQCPPFWSGELRWQGSQSRQNMVRTGHQLLAFHAFFDAQKPYASYQQSFEMDLKGVLQSIQKDDMFQPTHIIMQYVDVINFPTQDKGQLQLDEYLNIGVLKKTSQPVLSSKFRFDLQSDVSPQKRTMGISAELLPEKKYQPAYVRARIETTARQSLVDPADGFDATSILKHSQSIKTEMKGIFFDTLTDKTKDTLLEVQYACPN